MAKVFNLTGDVSLEDVNFSSTAARVQKNFDAAVSGIAQGSRTMGQALDGSTVAMGRFDKAAAATGGGMKQFRAGLAGAGLQVQDFVVQIGSGQSALVAFTQQAPQLASAFGPVGAVLGTVAAMGGAAAIAFGSMSGEADKAKAASDHLKEANDLLAGSLGASAKSVTELRQELETLSQVERDRARDRAEDAAANATKSLKEQADAVRDLAKANLDLDMESPERFGLPTPAEVQDSLDLVGSVRAELEKVGTVDLSAIVTSIRSLTGDDPAFEDFRTKLRGMADGAADAEKALKAAKEQMDIIDGRSSRGGSTPAAGPAPADAAAGPLAAADALKQEAEARAAAIRLEREQYEYRTRAGDAARAQLKADADAARAAAKERERLAEAQAKEAAGLAAYHATVQREIKQQQELAAAYEAGGEAVAEVTARHKAQQAVVAVVLSPEERAIVEEALA